MSTCRTALVSLFLSLLLQAPDASAQTAPYAPFGRLHPGALLRIHPTRLAPFEGRFAGLAADTLAADTLDHAITGEARYLLLAGEPRHILIQDIDRLSVRGHRAGRGALVGAGLGAIMLGGLSYAACSGLREYGNSSVESCWWAIPVGGFIGTIPGGVVGAIVGGMIPRWRIRYERAAL